jgi:hypothetical protein
MSACVQCRRGAQEPTTSKVIGPLHARVWSGCANTYAVALLGVSSTSSFRVVSDTAIEEVSDIAIEEPGHAGDTVQLAVSIVA